MSNRISDQTLVFPRFRPVYATLAPFVGLLLRLTLGLAFFAHGWGKLMDPAGVAAYLASEGYWAPMLMTWLLILTEVGGGLLLAVGLLVRPAAFAIIIFMLVAIFLQKWDNGFFYYANGFELDVVYLVVALKFLAEGSGDYSLDGRLRAVL